MRKAPHLVSDYLEDLLGDILDFPEVVENFVAGKHGIYALYRKGHLYYVGLATNLKARLKTHQKDRHSGKWDRFSVYLTTNGEHLKDLESLLLRVTKKPAGNKQNGKFQGAKNRTSELKKAFSENQSDQLNEMFNLKQIKSKPAGSSKQPKVPVKKLAESLQAPNYRALRAFYKGKTIKAIQRKDGSIRIGANEFSSLSAAGRFVTGRGTNGRWFWHVRVGKNEWQRISKLL